MSDVLVVDDDLDAAEIVADVLHGIGYEVRIAQNGVEGLAELIKKAPDVVLLDVEMPQLSGPDMAYQMFLHDVGLEDIPVVLCSGVVNLPKVAAVVGTPYFLPKPFPLATLLSVLGRALTERTPPRCHMVADGAARREGRARG
jgi:CheY-like chemotaxis protein